MRLRCANRHYAAAEFQGFDVPQYILGKINADGDNAHHFHTLVSFDETCKFHLGAFDTARSNFSPVSGR